MSEDKKKFEPFSYLDKFLIGIIVDYIGKDNNIFCNLCKSFYQFKYFKFR